MSAAKSLLSSKYGQLAVLVGVGAAAFYVVHKLLAQDVKDVAGAVGEGISGASEVVGGLATGRNVVTADTPYYDTGIFGTLGSTINEALGGAPQSIGEWIGGKLFDYSHDDYDPNANSATGNPYSPTGPNATYREAANNSPVNAQYAASPLALYGDTF